jgi:hypothetical protein
MDDKVYLSFDIGLRTLAVSKAVKHGLTYKFEQVDVFDLIQDDTINVASSPIECLLDRAVPNLLEVLRVLLEGISSSKLVIVIESQPTGRFAKNIKMKVVSHVLQGFLRMQIGPDPKIIFQSAHVKLQAAEAFVLSTIAAVPDDESAAQPNASTAADTKKRTRKAIRSEKYRQNKKTSVTACDSLTVAEHASQMPMIDVQSVLDIWKTVERKKRDDCADAIWQLIGFIGFHRPERAPAVKRKKVTVKAKAAPRKTKKASILSDLAMCDTFEE